MIGLRTMKLLTAAFMVVKNLLVEELEKDLLRKYLLVFKIYYNNVHVVLLRKTALLGLAVLLLRMVII